MHAAQWPELAGYILVVAWLQLQVILQGASFSSSAAAAVQRIAGTTTLPIRLSSILDVSQTRSDVMKHVLPAWMHLLWARPRDVSDVQWRDFRGALPLMALALGAFVFASRLAATRGPRVRLGVSLALTLMFLGTLHGAQAVWPLLFAGLSYGLAQAVAGHQHGVGIMWAWHIVAFVFVRHNNGVQYRWLSPALAHLDSQQGMLRWHIHYNLGLLRMLSYALDLHAHRITPGQWSVQKPPVSSTGAAPLHLKVAGQSPSSVAAGWGGLPLYLLYCFYPPLYIAGPIIPFSSFAAQLGTARSASHPPPIDPMLISKVLVYWIRWLGAWAVLEVVTRTLYFNAVAKHGLLTKGVLTAAGLQITPLHFVLTGFWVLVFMWLKFLVIWRFFRAMSLSDGIDPPENMLRCVCNNYTLIGFWKGWHASYNRWLVKYLYIPLGGKAWQALNIWPVFIFVALWHDLDPRMLAWGLLMPAAFLPELTVQALAATSWLAPHKEKWWFRQAAALLATFNILGLMSANLVGFVVGVEGIVPLLHEVLSQPRMAATVLGALFCGAQLMFAIRQKEAVTVKKIL